MLFHFSYILNICINIHLIMVYRNSTVPTALYGYTPLVCKKNLYNFVIYFSCIFGIAFDPVSEEPKRVSSKYLMRELKTLGREFVIVSVLISILEPYRYALFETRHEVHSMDHSLQDLFSWQHLMNNYLVACEYRYYATMNSITVAALY